MDELKELLSEVRKNNCANSQVSGTFHAAYYGSWDGYEHPHHPDCCEIIDGVHTPVKKG